MQINQTMKTIADLKKLDEKNLISFISGHATATTSAHIEMGKAIFLLDQSRKSSDKKSTLKKYVAKKANIDIPDHAFSTANAFRIVGVGFSYIDEPIYDSTPLRWLLVVSTILNLLNDFADTDAAQVREAVAVILREKPAKGYDLLMDIKKDLKPAPAGEGDGDGEGEGEGGETELPPVDLLSVEHLKAIGAAAKDCDDAKKLDTAVKALTAILTIATGKLEQLTTPAKAAA